MSPCLGIPSVCAPPSPNSKRLPNLLLKHFQSAAKRGPCCWCSSTPKFKCFSSRSGVRHVCSHFLKLLFNLADMVSTVRAKNEITLSTKDLFKFRWCELHCPRREDRWVCRRSPCTAPCFSGAYFRNPFIGMQIEQCYQFKIV